MFAPAHSAAGYAIPQQASSGRDNHGNTYREPQVWNGRSRRSERYRVIICRAASSLPSGTTFARRPQLPGSRAEKAGFRPSRLHQAWSRVKGWRQWHCHEWDECPILRMDSQDRAGPTMSGWLHTLPVVWMALIVFGATYFVALILHQGVAALSASPAARSFKALSPGMLPPRGSESRLLFS